MNRTARVMDAGHGGQILVLSSAAALAGDLGLIDLGEHHLKGLATPERLYQVGGRTSLRSRLPGNDSATSRSS